MNRNAPDNILHNEKRIMVFVRAWFSFVAGTYTGHKLLSVRTKCMSNSL